MVSQELFNNQEDCLLAISDGKPLPLDKLLALPPWRAVLIARIAVRAHVFSQFSLDVLVDNARRVGGNGDLRTVLGPEDIN